MVLCASNQKLFWFVECFDKHLVLVLNAVLEFIYFVEKEMKLSTLFATLILAAGLTACGEDAMDAAKGAAGDAAGAAMDAGKATMEAGGNVTDAAKDAAGAAVEAGKEAAAGAVDATKEAAGDAVDAAKEAAH